MAEPIVPTQPQTVAVPPPGAAPILPTNAPLAPVTLDEEYSQAAQTRDPAKMMQFANKVKDTPLHDVAINAYAVMDKNAKEFDALISPTQKAGGPATPQGRVAAADTWKTVKDNPKYFEGFVQYLMGNVNGARQLITGGVVKPQIVYDNAGNQLEEYKNELGERVRVLDVKNQREITPQEYEARRGGISNLADTLGQKTKEQMREFNVTDLNKRNIAANDWASAAPELSLLSTEKRNMLEKLNGFGLNNKDLEELYSFTTKQVGNTQSISKGFSSLNQYAQTKGVGVSESQAKEAKTAAGVLGLRFTADGKLVNDKNENVSKSDLDNLQKSYLAKNDFEQNFTQARAEALKSAVYKNLSQDQKLLFDAILENDKKIERKQAELISKHGTLPFLVSPAAMEVPDQFARAEVQAVLGQYNAEISDKFARWRKEQVAEFEKRGQVPSAGELEAQFVKTDIFKDTRQKYHDDAMKVRTRPMETATEKASTPVGGTNQQPKMDAQKQAVPPTPRQTLVPAPAPTGKASIGDILEKFKKK
jgi:hypothetical protein